MFVGVASVVCLTAVVRLRSVSSHGDFRAMLFFGCVTIALISPRFKDYSYLLLIVPAYFAIRHSAVLRSWPLALALLCLPQHHKLPFFYSAFESLIWPYFPLLLAYGVWLLYVFDILRTPGASGVPEGCSGAPSGPHVSPIPGVGR